MMLRTLVLLLCVPLLMSGLAAGQFQSPLFEPAAPFASVQHPHRRLPTDDIWWTVNGPVRA